MVNAMEVGKLVGDSFDYAKDGLVGKWVDWILLIISCIIFPLIMGYSVRVMKGATTAPKLEDWVGMFIDGLKLFIIALIYAIPVLILLFFFVGAAILTAATASMTNPGYFITFLTGMMLYLLILVIVAVIIWLIEATAFVRFARTGSMGEAFNFSAVFAQIGKIGWLSYIIALIVMAIIIGIIACILSLIPVIGWLLYLIVLPLLAIFHARYISLLYDSAGAA